MLDTTFSKNLSYWDLDLQCISCSLKPFMNFFFFSFYVFVMPTTKFFINHKRTHTTLNNSKIKFGPLLLFYEKLSFAFSKIICLEPAASSTIWDPTRDILGITKNYFLNNIIF